MAPVMSRFQILVSKQPCGSIMHPWAPNSCCTGALEIMRAAVANTIPFATLFYLAKLGLRRYSTGDAQVEIERFPSRVLRTTLFGVLVSGGFVFSACFLRRLLGEFRLFTLALVPGCIGGLAIYTQHDRDLRYFLDTFFVTAVEYCVRVTSMSGGQQRSHHRGGVTETLLFATINSLLTLLQRIDRTGSHVPWFHWPDRVQVKSSEHQHQQRAIWPLQRLLNRRHEACKHPGACVVFMARGLARFAALGTALSVLQDAVPRARAFLARKSHVVHGRLFSWTLPAFLATYVAIFRGSRCLLCWLFGEDVPLHCAISGMLAGFCYSMHPSYSVFAAALAALIELVWRRLVEMNVVPAALRSNPRLVCVLSLGLLMHAYAVEPPGVCPPVAGLFITPCTGGRAAEMVAEFRKIMTRAQ